MFCGELFCIVQSTIRYRGDAHTNLYLTTTRFKKRYRGEGIASLYFNVPRFKKVLRAFSKAEVIPLAMAEKIVYNMMTLYVW